MTIGPTISVSQARQLAITRQGLAGNHRPNGILDLVRRIGCLQLDPINVVARSHLLVLWSRLGTIDGPSWTACSGRTVPSSSTGPTPRQSF